MDMTTQMIPAWVDGQLRPVEKMAVHQRGLRHRAVSVFIMADDQLLIQRRAMDKYHTPGLWANTCCTHPAWGETAIDCAVRRLREELGIKRVYPSFRGQVEYRADVGGGLTEHEVVDMFVADASLSLEITPNPDEVMLYEWIDIYDLDAQIARRPHKFTPWMKIYMERHRDLIFR